MVQACACFSWVTESRDAEISLMVGRILKMYLPQIPHPIELVKMMTYHSCHYVHYDAYHHVHNYDYDTMIMLCYTAKLTLRMRHSNLWI